MKNIRTSLMSQSTIFLVATGLSGWKHQVLHNVIILWWIVTIHSAPIMFDSRPVIPYCTHWNFAFVQQMSEEPSHYYISSYETWDPRVVLVEPNSVHLDLFCFQVDEACESSSVLITSSEYPYSLNSFFPKTLMPHVCSLWVLMLMPQMGLY